MNAPVHPMDEELAKCGWRRARLEDVGDASAKLVIRLVCHGFSSAPVIPLPLNLFDIRVWREAGGVRTDLVVPGVHPWALGFVGRCARGVTPYTLGLVPCAHGSRHWNPCCLPVVWQPEMGGDGDTSILRRYQEVLTDTSWQCPDAAQLMKPLMA